MTTAPKFCSVCLGQLLETGICPQAHSEQQAEYVAAVARRAKLCATRTQLDPLAVAIVKTDVPRLVAIIDALLAERSSLLAALTLFRGAAPPPSPPCPRCWCSPCLCVTLDNDYKPE